MRALNSELQANHGILLAIESAKRQWESVIENMDGIFAIFNSKFELLFCNKKLAQMMGLTLWGYYRQDIRCLFSPAELNTLVSFMQNAHSTAPSKNQSFELNMRTGITQSPFLIILSRLNLETSEGPLYSLFGQDLSALKNSERRLAGVFSAIPLGVVTLGPGGLIEDLFSETSNSIMGQRSFVGKTLLETLMVEAKDELFIAEINAVQALESIIGKTYSEFESIARNLPLELHSMSEDSEGQIIDRWISINYKPVLNGEFIERVTVVFEDKTQWVQLERERAKLDLLEDDIVRRLFQVRSVSPEYALTMQSEIGTLFESASLALQKRNRKDLLRTLHALKGNFRAVAFNDLSKLIHDLEEFVLSHNEQNPEHWREISQRLGPVEREWSAVNRTIIFAREESDAGRKNEPLHTTTDNLHLEQWKQLGNTIDKINSQFQYAARVYETEQLILKVKKQNMVELAQLELPLLEQFKRVLAATNKTAKLTFHWDGIVVSHAVSNLIKEALLHLLNNAVDHGIESEAERLQAGKPAKGQIKITSSIDSENRLSLTMTDDGRGISENKVIEKALQKGLIQPENVYSLTSSDILSLIFKPEFSTKDNVTEISGRGIGLDAVFALLSEINGKIEVRSKPGKGSEFTVNLFAGYQFGVARHCMTASKFVGFIDEMITFLRTEGLGEIHFEPQILRESGQCNTHQHEDVIYVDAEKLVVAITMHSLLSPSKKSYLKLRREGKTLVVVFCENTASIGKISSVKRDDDQFLRNLYFSDIIQQHHAEIVRNQEGNLGQLEVPNAFIEDFEMTVAFSRSIPMPEAESFFCRLERVVKSLSGRLTLLPSPNARLDLWVSNEVSTKELSTLRTSSSDSILEDHILNRLTMKTQEA